MEKRVLSTNDAGTIGHPYAKKEKKKKNLDTDPIPVTKITSKWTKDPNVKCQNIQLLEDNIGEILDDLEFGVDI